MNLTGRSLLTLADYSRTEIEYLVDLSIRLKQEWQAQARRPRRLEGYTLAMIFEKLSTRTRSAFETAFGEEGGLPVFLSKQDIHLGSKEDLEDTARVLGRMYDCIQFRGFSQATVEALAKWSGVPVYNGLTDDFHPTQALADLMTLKECRGSLDGAHMAYVGDGRNNVARSLLVACARIGVTMSVGSPAELSPDPAFVATCSTEAHKNGARVEVTTDPVAAVRGADAVYTDVWVSMGEESEAARRAQILSPYRVTTDLMRCAGNDAVFLHCLPAVKGQEVTVDVFEGPASRVFDQAENRKHTIKAVLLSTLGRVDAEQ